MSLYPVSEDLSNSLRQRRPRPRKVVAITTEEASLLLEGSAAFIRSRAMYVMALGAGMRARHLAALELGDVEGSGGTIVETVMPRRLASAPGRRPTFTLGPAVRRAVAQYLVWRKARCAHFRTPLRTYLDSKGTERCLSCCDVADPRRAPLFVGQRGTRLSEKHMRRDFDRWCRELNLDARLRFDSMRAAFQAGVCREVHLPDAGLSGEVVS